MAKGETFSTSGYERKKEITRIIQSSGDTRHPSYYINYFGLC